MDNTDSLVKANQQLRAMTRAQKVEFALSNFAEVAQLGVPALIFSDGGNGVRDAPGATAFPSSLALAATFDRTMATEFGAALASEVKLAGRNALLGPALDIARVPLSGRLSESFGEDPHLVGELGGAVIAALQARNVLSVAKHYVANNFETGRTGYGPFWRRSPAIDIRLGERALHEIYLAPFKAATTKYGVGALMGSYNRLNGEYVCQSDRMISIAKHDWGWSGFFVPDFIFAVRDPLAAASAGMDIGGLDGASGRTAEMFDGVQITDERLDDMVRRVLFAINHVRIPSPTTAHTSITSTERQELARDIAGASMTLLKNTDGLLPLRAETTQTIALIGPSGDDALLVMGGSAAVELNPERIATVQSALAASAAQKRMTVLTAQGTWGDRPLPNVPATAYGPSGVDVRGFRREPDGAVTEISTAIPAIAPEHLVPEWGADWEAEFSGWITAETAGPHRLSLELTGKAQLFVDGTLRCAGEREASPMLAGPRYPLHCVVDLPAGTPVPFRIDYATGPAIMIPELGIGPSLTLGWQPPDNMIEEAAEAARQADVAVVLVQRAAGEAMDADTLELPGDQNALVAAVAAANPKTVVVSTSGGPFTMPWLDSVSAVLHAWYPGEQFGPALAEVLFGDAEPRGRLPITFPRGMQQTPVAEPSRFPGVDGVADYDDGLHVGYRWYDYTNTDPLFPFGFGLGYSECQLEELHVDRDAGSLHVSVRIRNVGQTSTSACVQFYVESPDDADSTPRALRGFERLVLSPGEASVVRTHIELDDLQIYEPGSGWRLAPGDYEVKAGFSSRELPLSGGFHL